LHCGSRVVVAASSFAGGLDLDDVEYRGRRFRGRAAYQASKQANRLWTWELARRLDGTGITANAVAPGMAWTGLYREVRGVQRAVVRLVDTLFGQTPEEAADTLCWATTAPELDGVSGELLEKRKRVQCRFRDPVEERRLWTLLDQ
jgi:NAD(P)-dependent dehydrogenase (short-subunit alcohol dehydrogenase family)